MPPDSSVACETSEFSFEAKTNSRGFRDREFGPKTAALRIMAIGDSFTYGWGVAQEDSWPKQLEALLKGGAEVANLGMAGGSPRTYVEIAARAVSRLRPDIVILALLSADDVVQELQEPPTPSVPAYRRLLGRGGRLLVPRLVPPRWTPKTGH